MSIKDKSIKDVDVLCGRGNKINYTLGNIRFRKLVDQHRYDYVTAPRHSKVDIANKVIEAVHKSGGRFLGLDPKTNRWVEVPLRRATEKACQALREDATHKIQVMGKKKREGRKKQSSIKKSAKNPLPAAKQSSGPINPSKSNRDEYKSRKNLRTQSGLEYHSRKKSDRVKSLTAKQLMEGMALHDRMELVQLSPEGESEFPRAFSPRLIDAPTIDDHPLARPYRYYATKTEEEWFIMYNRLQGFKKVFGHTAVSPRWAGDPDLADWTCRQRQLYREVVQTRHREPSELEQLFIQKLEGVNFIWDYDLWNWSQCCDRVRQRLHARALKHGCGSTCRVLPANEVFWLEEQQELAMLCKLSPARSRRLEILDGGPRLFEESGGHDYLLV